MELYTIRFTIYSDISFEQLKELINSFLKDSRFVTGEDSEDDLNICEIINKWRNNDDHCYSVIYPSRIYYSLIGSGIGIKLSNAYFVQSTHDDEDDYGDLSVSEKAPSDKVEIEIPEPITKRFERKPNLIEIDSHKFWLDHGDLTAHKIALYLANRGYKTYMLAFADELFFIKRSPIYSDEERVEKILNYMEKFYFNMDTDDRVQDELKSVVGSKWDVLDFRIKKFLITGFFLFDLFDQKGDLYVDVSPASIGITKGIETIVLEYLQLPFKKYCIDTYGLENLRIQLAADKELPFNNRMAEFLLEDNRSLELGAFNFFINKIISDPATQNARTGQLIIEFFLRRGLYDFMLGDPASFNQPIYKITNVYRNGAAHTKEMEFSKLLEYVQLLIGKDKTNGFLTRLINNLV